MRMNRLSRTLYILAVMAILIGGVVSFATNGRQFLPMLVLAIVLAGVGLIVSGKRNG